jgi:acetolactate synthase-1/2/3 large subunit
MPKSLVEAIYKSRRPVLVYGWGVRLSHAEKEAEKFAHSLGIPIVLTWGARDLLPESDGLVIGGFGTHGTRAPNFAIQNADLLICVGTRLDTKATGTPSSYFARGAKIYMVDIDENEINKFGGRVTGIVSDARKFFQEAQSWVDFAKEHDGLFDFLPWQLVCSEWKKKYPPVLPEYGKENPYVIVKELSNYCDEGDIIVSDTGCAVAWMMQAFQFKRNQRFLHPFNQTPMGYALPAAIGAHYATGKRVITVTGDGSIMMNIGELATISKRKLPVKMLLMNNFSHSMCRQSQREWFGGKYPATSVEGGLSFPDFDKCASGFEISLVGALAQLTDSAGPSMYHARIDPDCDVVPKNKFGFPLEDSYPHLPRDEFLKNMIVEPIRA